MQEIAIHGRIHHPHVLTFYAAFVDNYYLCILLELALSSDLYKRMPEIRRDEATVTKYVIGPLIFTLAYLHEMDVVHRDIKPENVLLRCSHVLLSDFGFSINVSRQRPVTRLGTLHFMAPELLLDDPGNPTVRREQVPRNSRMEYGTEVDIWAVGVLAYELFTRCAPFDGESEDAVVEAVVTGAPINFPSDMSPDAVDFITRCLERDPRRRPSALMLTKHPMVVNNMSPERVAALDPALFLPSPAARADQRLGERRRSESRASLGVAERIGSIGRGSLAGNAVGAPWERRDAMHSQMMSRASNGSVVSLGLTPGYHPGGAAAYPGQFQRHGSEKGGWHQPGTEHGERWGMSAPPSPGPETSFQLAQAQGRSVGPVRGEVPVLNSADGQYVQHWARERLSGGGVGYYPPHHGALAGHEGDPGASANVTVGGHWGDARQKVMTTLSEHSDEEGGSTKKKKPGILARILSLRRSRQEPAQ